MTNPILQLYIEAYLDAWESFRKCSWFLAPFKALEVQRAYSLLLEANENSRQLTKL